MWTGVPLRWLTDCACGCKVFNSTYIVLISVIASIPFLTSSYSVGTITLEEFQDARNGFLFYPKLLAELCTFALQLYVRLSCHKHKDDAMLLTCKNRIEWSHTVRIFLVDEQTKYERFFVRSSMVLEKRGTISEEENRLFFFFFLYDKKKDLLPILFL